MFCDLSKPLNGLIKTKNPADLLRRVLKYIYYTYIIFHLPESNCTNDDDVFFLNSFNNLRTNLKKNNLIIIIINKNITTILFFNWRN